MELLSFSYGVILTLLILLIISCSGSEGFTTKDGIKTNNAKMIALCVHNYAFLDHVMQNTHPNDQPMTELTKTLFDKVPKANNAFKELTKNFPQLSYMIDDNRSYGNNHVATNLLLRYIAVAPVEVNRYIPYILPLQQFYAIYADALLYNTIDMSNVTDLNVTIADLDVTTLDFTRLFSINDA